MPSFLNKVFGYRKHDDGETLLDGKYEAISPTLSPVASTFPDQPDPFAFFKPKSRTAQKHVQKPDAAPHLTLQLPAKDTDARSARVVFEADPDAHTLLDDAVIAAKRLSPLEALVLVRLCARAINERGLETLGVMHPHWFSASPDAQRKLISLFIRSLTPHSQPATLSSPASAFEDELHFTRSPHDVAAVLRWGLRHLSLDNGQFGKNPGWSWYNTFFSAERSTSYPPNGFSELLLPQLPSAHLDLLTATLSLISSLASHAEANGISGSKLSKFFGLWLLVANRAEQSDDWHTFYARWERAGRILEHVFLVRLREESFAQRLPTRLQELVKFYPYKGSPSSENDLLPRPRFSTRQYDALLVRVETVLVPSAEQPKNHPIQLLLDAFQLPIENPSADEHLAFWNTLKSTVSEQVASPESEGPQFAHIFVDETMQLLALLPTDTLSSPVTLSSPLTKVRPRKRTPSPFKPFNGSTPASPTSPSSPAVTDWAQFSLSGFGDTSSAQPLAALLHPTDDIELSQSQLSRKSSRQRGKSRSRRRSPGQGPHRPELDIIETKLASVQVVQIDEAFIDFWSDAVVDPVSANWPTFLVCGLKQLPSAEHPVRWLVIEQAYGRQQLQSSRVPSPDGRRGRSPRPSFKSDISGFRINTMFSSARKRLSVFSKSVTDLDPRKTGAKSPVTGELGEVLVEEDPPAPPRKGVAHAAGNGAIGSSVASYATAKVADQLKVNEIFTAPITTGPTPDQAQEKSDSVQAVAKAPSVEPTPPSGGNYDSPSGLPRLPVSAPEKARVVVIQGSPSAPDGGDSKANAVDTHASIASARVTTQGASDPVAPAGPPSVVEIPILQTVPDTVSEPEPHDDTLADTAAAQPNAAQVGSHLDDVAMPPARESRTATPVVAAAVVGQASGDIAEEAAAAAGHVTEPPPSAQTPVDEDPVPRAASAAGDAPRADDDDGGDDDEKRVPSLSHTHGSAELGARLGSDAVIPLEDDSAAGEVREIAEVHTPVPHAVTLVEETPAEAARRGPVVAAAAASDDPEARVADGTSAGCVPAEQQAPPSALATAQALEDFSVEAEQTADHVSAPATEQGPLGDVVEPHAHSAAGGVIDDVVVVAVVPTAAAVLPQDAPGTVEEDAVVPTPITECPVRIQDTPSPEIALEDASSSVGPAPDAVEDAGCEAPRVPVDEELPAQDPVTQRADDDVEPRAVHVHVEDEDDDDGSSSNSTRSPSEPVATAPPTVTMTPGEDARSAGAVRGEGDSSEAEAQSTARASAMPVSVPEGCAGTWEALRLVGDADVPPRVGDAAGADQGVAGPPRVVSADHDRDGRKEDRTGGAAPAEAEGDDRSLLAQAAPAVEEEKTVDMVAEPSVESEVNGSAQEPVGLTEETVPAEP